MWNNGQNERNISRYLFVFGWLTLSFWQSMLHTWFCNTSLYILYKEFQCVSPLQCQQFTKPCLRWWSMGKYVWEDKPPIIWLKIILHSYITFSGESWPTFEIFQYSQGWLWYSQIFQHIVSLKRQNLLNFLQRVNVQPTVDDNEVIPDIDADISTVVTLP